MSCAVCDGGLNTIVPLDVPTAARSEGIPTDVSGLVGDKSVEVSGTYDGLYVILGSHDGLSYVPILNFSSGVGVESFKQSMAFILRFVKVRRRSRNLSPVNISIGSRLTCPC